LDSGADVKNKV